MSLLSAYLSKSKVKKILSLKPGQEGFSLIELVVVVAVLAVLSAIAIPQFTNISNKARAAAAANTVATVAKECAAKIADQGSGTYIPPITMQGYSNGSNNNAGWHEGGSSTSSIGTRITATTARNCPTTANIGLESENEDEYPSFYYNVSTGEKACAAASGKPAEQRGCTSGQW